MTFLNRYLHPKVLVVLLLGFSSGLPRLLVASTLAAWLSDNGVEKAAIGLFAYVALPYSLNFAWAPLIDHLRIPLLDAWLGRRRSWMIVAQTALAASLLILSGLNPSETPFLVAALALLVAFFSASQDVVIDAYRTEYLDTEQYGEGAAVAVLGYRLGMLVAGAGALAMADFINWSVAYITMAGFMLVGMVTILLAGEPEVSRQAPRDAHQSFESWFKDALISPFVHFMQRHQNWWMILLFVALYRMSDGFIGFMATPFMLDIGFSKTDIAAIGKVYGFAATLLGTFLGGALLYRLGMFRSLLLFGIFQLGTNLTYIIMAVVGAQTWALMLAITCDNLAGGMITAAAIAFMMRLCDPAHTATQYALLSSLASLASILLAGAAGVVAEQYGWVAMFTLSGVLGVPSIVLLWKLRGHAMVADVRGGQ